MQDYLNLLTNLDAPHCPLPFLEAEVKMLSQIVSDIGAQIKRRVDLERTHSQCLVQEQLSLESKLLNLDRGGNGKEKLRELIHSVKSEQVRVQETAARDMIELRKSLWHYSGLLYRKQAQMRFLK